MNIYRLPVVAALLLSFSRSSQAQQLELRFDKLSPEQLEPFVQSVLDSASRSLERLLARRGPRTVANTLRPYDDYRILVNRTRVVSLIHDVHPDSAVRDAAARAEDLLDAFNQKRRTDRRIYDMLAAVDLTNADPEVKFWVGRELDRFRDEAVNRPDSVRARVAELNREIERLQRAWRENPRRDTITVAFDSMLLTGMNRNWLAQRPRGSKGEVLVGGEDLRMVGAQAPNSEARRLAMLASMRMRPNHYVLDTLLRVRYQLATVLGYRSYAEYQLKDGMAGNPENVRKFLDDVRGLTAPALKRTLASATTQQSTIPLYDLLYVRASTSAEAGVGPQLRPYLSYENVRKGIFDLAREFMGLDFRAAPDLPVWEKTVEAYRVFENGKLIGNVYLDLHWRPGRSVQAAGASNFRLGVTDRAITEAAIIGGMLRPVQGEPLLMGVRPMQTLFHEFGHLMHYLVATRPWFATSGLPDAFDFREVPSTLFEAWAQDSAVVSRFARHWQTGEPAPPALLGRLSASQPGPTFMAQFMSRMSLELHDRAPGDMHAVVRQAFNDAQPPGLPVRVTLPEGDIHPEATFQHLGNGYDAAYYTYLWSQVISRDLLTRFTKGLLDAETVHAYRTQILASGRSRPVAESITLFLGRPFSLDAWAKSIPLQ